MGFVCSLITEIDARITAVRIKIGVTLLNNLCRNALVEINRVAGSCVTAGFGFTISNFLRRV